MHQSHRYPITPPQGDVDDLRKLIEERRVQANALRASSRDRHSFWLISKRGAVEVIFKGHQIRFICELPFDFPTRVALHLERTGAKYYTGSPLEDPDDNRVRQVIELVAHMGIAPQVRALYGFVYIDRVVGLTFLTRTQRDSFEKARQYKDRDLLGYSMDTYVLGDISRAFPFIGETKPTRWLSHFWNACREGKIVELSERLKQPYRFDLRAYDGGAGKKIWLQFDHTDGQSPQLVKDAPYFSLNRKVSKHLLTLPILPRHTRQTRLNPEDRTSALYLDNGYFE